MRKPQLTESSLEAPLQALENDEPAGVPAVTIESVAASTTSAAVAPVSDEERTAAEGAHETAQDFKHLEGDASSPVKAVVSPAAVERTEEVAVAAAADAKATAAAPAQQKAASK